MLDDITWDGLRNTAAFVAYSDLRLHKEAPDKTYCNIIGLHDTSYNFAIAIIMANVAQNNIV